MPTIRFPYSMLSCRHADIHICRASILQSTIPAQLADPQPEGCLFASLTSRTHHTRASYGILTSRTSQRHPIVPLHPGHHKGTP
eukprot:866600-Pelagomonas_calceolata.AAC.5